MFSIEARVNGTLVGYISGQNLIVNTHTPEGKDQYRYEYFKTYGPGLGNVVAGEVMHWRKEGLEKLVKIILEDILEKEKEDDKST